jgi:hypothetical protein
MATTIETDLCVIGAGSGGLSVAAGAVQMGARVVLIEKGRMGGDCLNYGCVPSKALIAAAGAADTVRHAGRFGVNGNEPVVDYAALRDHLRGVIAAIAPHDSVERFEALGVTVLQKKYSDFIRFWMHFNCTYRHSLPSNQLDMVWGSGPAMLREVGSFYPGLASFLLAD